MDIAPCLAEPAEPAKPAQSFGGGPSMMYEAPRFSIHSKSSKESMASVPKEVISPKWNYGVDSSPPKGANNSLVENDKVEKAVHEKAEFKDNAGIQQLKMGLKETDIDSGFQSLSLQAYKAERAKKKNEQSATNSPDEFPAKHTVTSRESQESNGSSEHQVFRKTPPTEDASSMSNKQKVAKVGMMVHRMTQLLKKVRDAKIDPNSISTVEKEAVARELKKANHDLNAIMETAPEPKSAKSKDDDLSDLFTFSVSGKDLKDNSDAAATEETKVEHAENPDDENENDDELVLDLSPDSVKSGERLSYALGAILPKSAKDNSPKLKSPKVQDEAQLHKILGLSPESQHSKSSSKQSTPQIKFLRTPPTSPEMPPHDSPGQFSAASYTEESSSSSSSSSSSASSTQYEIDLASRELTKVETNISDKISAPEKSSSGNSIVNSTNIYAVGSDGSVSSAVKNGNKRGSLQKKGSMSIIQNWQGGTDAQDLSSLQREQKKSLTEQDKVSPLQYRDSDNSSGVKGVQIKEIAEHIEFADDFSPLSPSKDDEKNDSCKYSGELALDAEFRASRGAFQVMLERDAKRQSRRITTQGSAFFPSSDMAAKSSPNTRETSGSKDSKKMSDRQSMLLGGNLGAIMSTSMNAKNLKSAFTKESPRESNNSAPKVVITRGDTADGLASSDDEIDRERNSKNDQNFELPSREKKGMASRQQTISMIDTMMDDIINSKPMTVHISSSPNSASRESSSKHSNVSSKEPYEIVDASSSPRRPERTESELEHRIGNLEDKGAKDKIFAGELAAIKRKASKELLSKKSKEKFAFDEDVEIIEGGDVLDLGDTSSVPKTVKEKQAAFDMKSFSQKDFAEKRGSIQKKEFQFVKKRSSSLSVDSEIVKSSPTTFSANRTSPKSAAIEIERASPSSIASAAKKMLLTESPSNANNLSPNSKNNKLNISYNSVPSSRASSSSKGPDVEWDFSDSDNDQSSKKSSIVSDITRNTSGDSDGFGILNTSGSKSSDASPTGSSSSSSSSDSSSESPVAKNGNRDSKAQDQQDDFAAFMESMKSSTTANTDFAKLGEEVNDEVDTIDTISVDSITWNNTLKNQEVHKTEHKLAEALKDADEELKRLEAQENADPMVHFPVDEELQEIIGFNGADDVDTFSSSLKMPGSNVKLHKNVAHNPDWKTRRPRSILFLTNVVNKFKRNSQTLIAKRKSQEGHFPSSSLPQKHSKDDGDKVSRHIKDSLCVNQMAKKKTGNDSVYEEAKDSRDTTSATGSSATGSAGSLNSGTTSGSTARDSLTKTLENGGRIILPQVGKDIEDDFAFFDADEQERKREEREAAQEKKTTVVSSERKAMVTGTTNAKSGTKVMDSMAVTNLRKKEKEIDCENNNSASVDHGATVIVKRNIVKDRANCMDSMAVTKLRQQKNETRTKSVVEQASEKLEKEQGRADNSLVLPKLINSPDTNPAVPNFINVTGVQREDSKHDLSKKGTYNHQSHDPLQNRLSNNPFIRKASMALGHSPNLSPLPTPNNSGSKLVSPKGVLSPAVSTRSNSPQLNPNNNESLVGSLERTTSHNSHQASDISIISPAHENGIFNGENGLVDVSFGDDSNLEGSIVYTNKEHENSPSTTALSKEQAIRREREAEIKTLTRKKSWVDPRLADAEANTSATSAGATSARSSTTSMRAAVLSLTASMKFDEYMRQKKSEKTRESLLKGTG